MTKEREALTLALEALKVAFDQTCSVGRPQDWQQIHEAITAVKEALMSLQDGAQPEQEPTKLWCETCEGTGEVYQEHQAGCHVGGHFKCPDCDGEGYVLSRLYSTTPPQPKEPEHEPVAFPDAPQTIYLQVGDECPEDAKWKELVDVCWCDEQVFDNDIVYVRADTTPPQRKPSKEHALYETFAKIAAYLEIDTEAAQSAAGKPSDVFIEAIKKREAPQRTWVGLSDEDKKQIAKEANYNWEMTTGEYAERIGRLTEEKLKELNT